MSDILEKYNYCTTALGVDDAVGISENRVWYMAVVKRNSEKLIREKLLQQGYDAYVATQKEEHR